MDALRGIAVLLVILQHSNGIPRTYSGITGAEVLDYSTGFLAPFRMPMLLLLSGLLLVPSVRKPLKQYYDGKIRKVVWPYLVWGVIVALVTLSPAALLTVEFWRGGPSHLWFLTVLMACYLIGPSVRFVPPWVIPVSMIAVLVLVDPSTNFYRRILFFGAFFFIGAAIYPHLRWLQSRGPWLPVLAGGAALVIGVLSMLGHVSVGHQDPWTIAASLPGLLLAVWSVPRLPRMPWMEFAGRRSIVLYCVHAPVMIAVTLLAGSLVEVSTPLFFALVVVAGFGIPVLIAMHYDRFLPLFELPALHPAALPASVKR